MPRPTLSVCLVTTNSSDRLAWWCEQARRYADQVVIAVDAASGDDTYAVAAHHGDQVYPVDLRGVPGAARDWLHQRAGGDWILMLADDEILPPDAPTLLGDVLADRHATHYRLPVRRVVEDGGTPGWVPDPAAGPGGEVRLWRNLGGLHFLGASRSEAPAVLGRGRSLPGDGPLAIYALGDLWAGTDPPTTHFITGVHLDAPRRLGPALARTERPAASRVISAAELETHLIMGSPATSPWSAAYHLVEAPAEVTANGGALMRVRVRNTSDALWTTSGLPAGRITLGNRWSTPGFGDEIPMGDVTLLPRPLAPGEEVEVEAGLWTPRLPGRYRLTVELMREGDAWFSQHGVPPLTLEVDVNSGDLPRDVRHFAGRLPDDPDRDPSSPVPSASVASSPVRVLDTRDSSGVPGAIPGPISQDGMVVLALAGVAGVPPEAAGVTVTVTTVGTDYHGWLAVFGTDGTTGQAFPVLHFADDGRPVTATVTAALGTGRGHGKLSFRLAPGPDGSSGHLIIDVRGYLVPA
jgi:hypothetical protein